MTDPSYKAPSIDLLGNPFVFDDVVVGIFRSTEEGRYVYANHRLAELYGYDSPAQLIEAIWDIEGAVESEVGAKRVMHEVGRVGLLESGCPFVNCEDGLLIPY